MQITFLGTGTSTGIPQIGCTCPVCTSANPKDNRLRTSAVVSVNGKNILIDCGPDFRQQVLRAGIGRIDAVLITHIHYDHTGGIDDLRPFGGKHTLPIYLEPSVAEGIRTRLPYCFGDHLYPGVPNIRLQEIGIELFTIENIEVTPIRVMHYKLPILGYRIGGLVYITDALTIPDEEYAKMKQVDVLVINALRKQPHLSHQTLDEALRVIERVQPREAYLVHMSHHMGLTAEVEKELPPHVHFAYDGLVVESM
ncbi:MBL fold metallo-hydrolase [Barnesiella viscericola]|uniref:MBL fold metallo-hydrolase n=1 Tax=Barnesiella viscericola TaxID=397865 RepID=A0A921MSS5_9BACT|nr:MBL fold metallo-hydrolase [Barnesiella viscericola]HJG89909.1 MBL fold metallo-hydrolase [Barnesiella viscericola]